MNRVFRRCRGGVSGAIDRLGWIAQDRIELVEFFRYIHRLRDGLSRGILKARSEHELVPEEMKWSLRGHQQR